MTIDAFDARIAIAKTTDAADTIFRTRGTFFIGIVVFVVGARHASEQNIHKMSFFDILYLLMCI